MSIYREGYYALEVYTQKKQRIFNDAFDEGVFVKKGDKNWNMFKMLADMYVDDPKTRKMITSNQVQVEFSLINEWLVSDEIKSIDEATDEFELLYYKFRPQDKNLVLRSGFDGFFTITRKM